MLQDNITRLIKVPFDRLLPKAVSAITEHGFLIIHQIDPQAILARHGMEVERIRQLLFFHPVYMRQILFLSPDAVIEAPLKLVLREAGEGCTSISYFDIVAHFSGYPLPEHFGKELAEKQTAILAQLLT
jgi:uncharacterized protein (DUF302 family)